jgi:hypothetical protein
MSQLPTLVVEGYPDRLSYLPGEEVAFHCSARCNRFSAEIARIGGRREVVWRREGIPGVEQPTPNHAYAEGCGWPVTFVLRIPTDWRSGYYEVALQAEGVEGITALSHAFFVLRSAQPGRTTPIILVLSSNTYNAYNKWGGACLYTGAHTLSFNRPIERGFLTRPDAPFDGRVASVEAEPDPFHRRLLAYQAEHQYTLWTGSAGWHNWERRFVRWAEQSGYSIDMAINADLEFHPELLTGYRLMVSVGHDEYWSWAMRDTVDDFVAHGGNVAFFSGNTIYWQVRFADEGRKMVCYKAAAHEKDPVMGADQQHLLTSIWSDPLIGRPENSTSGLSFCRGGYVRMGQGAPRSSGAYTIYRPDHWVFADTGLRYGDLLGLGSYVVAYEVDGCEFTLVNGLPVPTHADGTPAGFTILGISPARLLSVTPTYSEIPLALWASPDPPGDLEFTAIRLFGDAAPEHVARLAHGHAVMGLFTRGGTVFNAGSADWAYGLDHDPLIQRVTRNVLDRLGSAG